MAFLHAHSRECLQSELLLFDTPPTQTSIEGSRVVDYKLISSLTDNSPEEFVVPKKGEEYIDLAHTILSLRVSLKSRVNQEDLSVADQEQYRELIDKVGSINNFIHLLFNQVDVFFNQKPVLLPTNAYFIELTLKRLQNTDSLQNLHTRRLFCAVTAGKLDEIGDVNKGLVHG